MFMWIFYVFLCSLDAKELLKVLAVSWGLVIVSPLKVSTVGTRDATVFREHKERIVF